MKFRKKPVVIEAVQWRAYNLDEVLEFLQGEKDCFLSITNPDDFCIKTLEGMMLANRLDWIIKGVKGEFYPCKPDIFEQTYEAVNE
jgi:hypothetical protein